MRGVGVRRMRYLNVVFFMFGGFYIFVILFFWMLFEVLRIGRLVEMWWFWVFLKFFRVCVVDMVGRWFGFDKC